MEAEFEAFFKDPFEAMDRFFEASLSEFGFESPFDSTRKGRARNVRRIPVTDADAQPQAAKKVTFTKTTTTTRTTTSPAAAKRTSTSVRRASTSDERTETDDNHASQAQTGRGHGTRRARRGGKAPEYRLRVRAQELKAKPRRRDWNQPRVSTPAAHDAPTHEIPIIRARGRAPLARSDGPKIRITANWGGGRVEDAVAAPAADDAKTTKIGTSSASDAFGFWGLTPRGRAPTGRDSKKSSSGDFSRPPKVFPPVVKVSVEGAIREPQAPAAAPTRAPSSSPIAQRPERGSIADRYGLTGIEDGNATWSSSDLKKLDDALALLTPTERKIISGMDLVVRRVSGCSFAGRCHNTTADEPTLIEINDSGRSVDTMLHELGHAIHFSKVRSTGQAHNNDIRASNALVRETNDAVREWNDYTNAIGRYDPSDRTIQAGFAERRARLDDANQRLRQSRQTDAASARKAEEAGNLTWGPVHQALDEWVTRYSIRAPTTYAATNYTEFYAEAFSHWKQDKLRDPNLRRFFDEGHHIPG